MADSEPVDGPVLLVQWERTLGDLLDRTHRFPKVARFTFTSRVDNLALDILEQLISARYASMSRRKILLSEADDSLARLRVLLRICHSRQYLDTVGFEYISRNLDETGKMLGGWRRSLGRQPE